MTMFKRGDVVRWNGADGADLYEVGTLAEVDRVEYIGDQEYLYVRVTNQDEITGHFSWRWDYVTSKTSDKEVTTVKTEPKKTGGSTPNQYRLSVNLPLTSDRTQFVDVDLEAMDVSDALDLSGNLRDVQKALFRMGKKDGVSEVYDFNKQLFCTLREMKKRGIISHANFWEATQALENILQAEDVA